VKRGIGAEFAYLTGRRLEAAVTQGLDRGRLSARAWYGVRLEQIGTLKLSGRWPLPSGICPLEESCPRGYDVPLGYLEQRAGLSALARLGARLDLVLSGAVAWRRYLRQSALRVVADGEARLLDPVRRRDRRLTLGLAAVLHPLPSVDLTLSGELAAVDSNVRRGGSVTGCQAPGYQCHALDYGDASARRATVGLDAAWRW
jgi:hypothetical protein